MYAFTLLFMLVKLFNNLILFNKGVAEELIGSITGHSTAKSTAGKIYMSGFNYTNKFETVNLLTARF